MTNAVDFRAEQARKIAELIDQATTLNKQQSAPVNQPTSQIEQEADSDPTRINHKAPAHRLQEQYSNNIAALGRSDEAFARNNQDPSKIVVKSGQAGIDYDRDPESPNQGVGLRSPATNPKLLAETTKDEPMHVRQPIAYEKAITTNEERIAELQNTPTTGAVAEMDASKEQATPAKEQSLPKTSTQSGEKSEIQSHVPISPPAPSSEDSLIDSKKPVSPDQEPTNTNFRYSDKELEFYKLAEGAILESGEGASVVDPNRTKTHVIVPNELRDQNTQSISLDDLDDSN